MSDQIIVLAFVKPDQSGLTPDGAGVIDDPWLLTGEHPPKLIEKATAIDFDAGWLGRDEERVTGRALEQFFPERESFPGHGWEVIINHEPVVVGFVAVEQEAAPSDEGVPTGKIRLPSRVNIHIRMFGQKLDPDFLR